MPAFPDHNKSERVWSIAERIGPEKAADITWMNEELVRRLQQVFEGSRGLMLMQMMHMGLISHEQGQTLTPDQLFLMAFHVGFETGREFEQQEGFNQSWGSTPPDA